MLTKLSRARLIRVTAGDTSTDAQVEVAHEALVRNWPRLVGWLEEERAAIAVRGRLEAKAAEWVRLGRGASGLLDAVQLGEAERLLAGGCRCRVPGLQRRATLAGWRPSRAALEQARAAETAHQNRAGRGLRPRQRWRVSGPDEQASRRQAMRHLQGPLEGLQPPSSMKCRARRTAVPGLGRLLRRLLRLRPNAQMGCPHPEQQGRRAQRALSRAVDWASCGLRLGSRGQVRRMRGSR